MRLHLDKRQKKNQQSFMLTKACSTFYDASASKTTLLCSLADGWRNTHPPKQGGRPDEADHPVEQAVFVHLVDAFDKQGQPNQSQRREQKRCQKHTLC